MVRLGTATTMVVLPTLERVAKPHATLVTSAVPCVHQSLVPMVLPAVDATHLAHQTCVLVLVPVIALAAVMATS